MMRSTFRQRRLARTQRGATMPEYALGLALIALVIVPLANWIQDESGDRYTDQETALADADLAVPTPNATPTTSPGTTIVPPTTTTAAPTTTVAPTTTLAPDTSAPSAPTLSITSTTCAAQGNRRDIALSWTAAVDPSPSSGIDHYEWTATWDNNSSASGSSTGTTATWTNGPKNKTVTITVIAVDGAGNISPASNPVTKSADVCG